jgi:hypothetical protein
MRRLLIAALMMVPAQAAQLRITVYDQAPLSKEVRQAAFDSLHQIFRKAGIELEVATGDPASREASLMESPAIPRKGTERAAACRARRDIALEIVGVTSPFRKKTMLGMAEPLARQGLNARVFDDRIQDAAMWQNRKHSAVLAHAIAHEIGHVLLRSPEHSRSGLMSAVWSDREYEWMARGVMFFTAEQGKAMRASLHGEGCATGTPMETLPQ